MTMIIVTKKQADIDAVLQEVNEFLDETNPALLVDTVSPDPHLASYAAGVKAALDWILGGPIHPLHAAQNEAPRMTKKKLTGTRTP